MRRAFPHHTTHVSLSPRHHCMTHLNIDQSSNQTLSIVIVLIVIFNYLRIWFTFYPRTRRSSLIRLRSRLTQIPLQRRRLAKWSWMSSGISCSTHLRSHPHSSNWCQERMVTNWSYQSHSISLSMPSLRVYHNPHGLAPSWLHCPTRTQLLLRRPLYTSLTRCWSKGMRMHVL